MIEKAQAGDQQAQAEIVRMHQPLIWAMARRLWCTYASCEDLMQAGNLGLMRAIRRYKPELDVRLTTYAVPWILGEMRRTLKRTEINRVSLDEPMGAENLTLYDVLTGGHDIDIGQIDLRLAMQMLSEESRLVISLRYFRERTQKETADLLGKSQAQISRMERKALDALHTMLSDSNES